MNWARAARAAWFALAGLCSAGAAPAAAPATSPAAASAAALAATAALAQPALTLAAEAAPPARPMRLKAADFLSRDSAQAPAADDPAWQSVGLPHVWNEAQQRERGGWYRLRFDIPAEGFGAGTTVAVYIPQAHVNAAVWFNGSLLGDGGRLDDPMTFHWNHPFLFVVPRAGLSGQGNELLVRVRAIGGFGLLSPLELGPERLLRPAYERRLFWQAEVHGVLALVLGTLALAALAIWNGRRHDTQYFWLGASSLAWGVFALFLYGQDFWIDPLAMQWLAHAGTNWWVTGLALYVHRQTGGARRSLERVLIGVTLVFNVATWVLPPLVRVHLFSAIHVLLLLTLAYLVVLALRHARASGQRASWGLAALCLGVLLAGIHDVIITMPVQWSSMELVQAMADYRFYLTPYGAPLASLLLGAHLARRYVATLTQLERLNADLEQRVEASRVALSQQFEQRRGLERAQAATQERERIVREMHDGIGGQLMTALRGVERGVFSPERIAEVLQDSLDDLRLLIDASAASSSLLPALAAWRSRWDPRLEALGVELRWQVDEALGAAQLQPDVVLQLMRLLQEAVTNTLKHAGADALEVRAAREGEALSLSVHDNGRGVPADLVAALRVAGDATADARAQDGGAFAGAGHHGLRSMHSRARAIGATLVLDNAPEGGTRVRLHLPLGELAPGPALPAGSTG